MNAIDNHQIPAVTPYLITSNSMYHISLDDYSVENWYICALEMDIDKGLITSHGHIKSCC